MSAGRRGFLAVELAGPVAIEPEALAEQDTAPEYFDDSPALLEAFHTLPPDEQLAVQFFVIDKRVHYQ